MTPQSKAFLGRASVLSPTKLTWPSRRITTQLMSHFEQKEVAVLLWLEQLTLGLDLPQHLMLGLWSYVVLILGFVSGSIRWWFPPWWTTWRRGWLWTASTSWTTSIRFPECISSFYGSYIGSAGTTPLPWILPKPCCETFKAGRCDSTCRQKNTNK